MCFGHILPLIRGFMAWTRPKTLRLISSPWTIHPSPPTAAPAGSPPRTPMRASSPQVERSTVWGFSPRAAQSHHTNKFLCFVCSCFKHGLFFVYHIYPLLFRCSVLPAWILNMSLFFSINDRVVSYRNDSSNVCSRWSRLLWPWVWPGWNEATVGDISVLA